MVKRVKETITYESHGDFFPMLYVMNDDIGTRQWVQPVQFDHIEGRGSIVLESFAMHHGTNIHEAHFKVSGQDWEERLWVLYYANTGKIRHQTIL